MSMSDPISDFLTRIRNGFSSNKKWVDIPSSKIKKRISLVLKEEKYIEDFYFISDDENKETIRIFLRYDYNGDSTIDYIKRVSPSRASGLCWCRSNSKSFGWSWNFYIVYIKGRDVK